MASAPTADLTFDLGSADSVTYQLLDNGTPVDLSSAIITQEVRWGPGQPIRLTRTIGDGITIVDAAQGVFRVDYGSADLEALGAGVFRYDVFTEIAGTRVMRVRGGLTVCSRITVLT